LRKLALIKKLVDEDFIHVSKSGRLLKRRRKLAESIAMESKLDMHERILCHVTSIAKYLGRHYSYAINRKAISWTNEVKGHPLLEGKEPLNVAAELVFLAGRQFGIKKLADYIHEETGVSKPYLYNHQEEYSRILKG